LTERLINFKYVFLDSTLEEGPATAYTLVNEQYVVDRKQNGFEQTVFG
jgi:hypothetical protein